MSLIVSILALITGIAVLAKAYLELQHRKYLSGFSLSENYRRAIHRMNALTCASQHELHAKRALVIATENGGDIYNKDGRRYISVRFESYDYPFEPCYDDFQRYCVDDDYHELIDDLIKDKKRLLIADQLPEGSFLRSYYQSKKIVASWVFVVHERKDRLCFASYNIIDPDVELEGPVQVALIQKYAHKMREVIDQCPEIMDPIPVGMS